jgi:hypothetical protein
MLFDVALRELDLLGIAAGPIDDAGDQPSRGRRAPTCTAAGALLNGDGDGVCHGS